MESKRALTIAGSDCSGGAGIQADLATFHDLGVYGSSAVTALVAENSLGVQGVHPVGPAFVALQVESCLSDIGADVVKTGMLVDAPTVSAVADALEKHSVPALVVDPVGRSTSGTPLLSEEGAKAMVARLFPLASVVTPNVPEAELIAGFPIAEEAGARRAAEAIAAMGPDLVVVTGGHGFGAPGEGAVDFAWDGADWVSFRGERVEGRHTHGTGCTFSAALAAFLALGTPPMEAVGKAKRYVTEAIRLAPGFGAGHGPLDHWVASKGRL